MCKPEIYFLLLENIKISRGYKKLCVNKTLVIDSSGGARVEKLKTERLLMRIVILLRNDLNILRNTVPNTKMPMKQKNCRFCNRYNSACECWCILNGAESCFLSKGWA